MDNHNQINHIVRNGLIDIQWKAHNIARQADDILKRCKKMEEALETRENNGTIKHGGQKVMKTLHNSDVSGARINVSDLNIFGNGDMFQLLCKASSQKEGWMKSTKAMEIPNLGCVVQVTTQQGDNVAEALCFVSGVKIIEDLDKGGRKLIRR